MDQADILAIVRHVLTAAGGILVTRGVIDDGQLQMAIGGVLAIAPVIWALVQKRQQRAAVINAAATGNPVQATATSSTTAGATP